MTNGGDRRTLETVNMEFRPWTAYNISADSYADQPFVTDTRLSVPDHDVTLDVAFTNVNTSTSSDNAKLGVDAFWTANTTQWYVNSYDLMMVPGRYTVGADVPLDEAVLVAADVMKSTGAEYEAEGAVNAPELNAESTLDYTLFIRANYAVSTGLTPTLHNLYPVQYVVGVPTGVNSVTAAKEVKSVMYYNMAGAMLSEPCDGVNIKVVTYTDGTTATTKVIK